MSFRLAVTLDVPDLGRGVAFYTEVFGFEETARPIPTYAILARDGWTLGIMEKAEGSRPAPGSDDTRRYARHWTPVHLDFHVADFEATLARAEVAGAVVEQRHEGGAGRPSVAFCADPFGHGFCILGPTPDR